MHTRDILIFDLEIKNPIAGSIGWKSFDRMGVSVGVSYSTKRDEYKVYLDDNLEDLHYALEKCEMVVGFNTLGFDVSLLEATVNKKMRLHHHYDILKESRHSHGSGNFTPGFKLDNHLAGTFGIDFLKTAHGAQAPIWYQEKKMGQLISYCVDDVKREAALFKYLWETGTVKLDSHGTIKIKRTPQEYFESIRQSQLF